MISQFPWFQSPVMAYLAGSCAQSHETATMVLAKLHYSLELGVLFPTHMAVSRIPIPVVVGLGMPASYWLSAGAWLPAATLCHVALSVGSLQQGCLLLHGQQENLPLQSANADPYKI